MSRIPCWKLLCLALAMLTLAAEVPVGADGSSGCPVSIFGSWNGRTYYYCRAGLGGNACNGSLTGGSDLDTNPHALGCDSNGGCIASIAFAADNALSFYGEIHANATANGGLHYTNHEFTPADSQCQVLASLDVTVAVPNADGTALENRPFRVHYVVSNRVKTTVNGEDQLVPILAAQQSNKPLTQPVGRARRLEAIPVVKFNVIGRRFTKNQDSYEDVRYKKIIDMLLQSDDPIPVVAVIVP